MRLTARTAFAVAFALTIWAARAEALIVNYTVALDGLQEVPAADLDGFGTALLTLDTSTNSITWNITVGNLDTVILDHIHAGNAGVNGPVVIDFSGALVGGPIIDSDVSAVVANPSAFYVNVHTTAFTGGAIRGQVPEPGTLAMFGAGLLGLAATARRRVR